MRYRDLRFRRVLLQSPMQHVRAAQLNVRHGLSHLGGALEHQSGGLKPTTQQFDEVDDSNGGLYATLGRWTGKAFDRNGTQSTSLARRPPVHQCHPVWARPSTNPGESSVLPAHIHRLHCDLHRGDPPIPKSPQTGDGPSKAGRGGVVAGPSLAMSTVSTFHRAGQHGRRILSEFAGPNSEKPSGPGFALTQSPWRLRFGYGGRVR